MATEPPDPAYVKTLENLVATRTDQLRQCTQRTYELALALMTVRQHLGPKETKLLEDTKIPETIKQAIEKKQSH